MSSVAKIKLSFYIIDIELKWMTTETDENAVETRGVNECWHSSFEFHKLSRMLIFITEWKQQKQGKESFTFFHEMNFGNILSLFSVSLIAF